MSDEPVRVELSDGLQGAKLFGELDLAVYEKLCAELTPLFETPATCASICPRSSSWTAAGSACSSVSSNPDEGDGAVVLDAPHPTSPGCWRSRGSRSSGSAWRTMGDGLDVVIPADSAELSELRRRVDAWAGPYLPPAAVQDLKLAITEACANAVQHSGTSEIRVSVRLVDDCVEVIVEDDGVYLVRRYGIDDDEQTHRGMALMAAMVDDLTLRPGTESSAGTTVRDAQVPDLRWNLSVLG